jgi:hypothetical protein
MQSEVARNPRKEGVISGYVGRTDRYDKSNNFPMGNREM